MRAETLYRQYRPSQFADVVNQGHIKQILQNEIVSQTYAHAYIFYGTRGIGKTTLARIFAKSLICEKRDKKNYEPCDDCSTCKSVREGNHLDVIEMDAATHTQVDKVRENIINAARSLPSSRPFKIFIIDEVHMLSTSSFNALLKIIEEPPEHVIFILATTEVHKVPPTIISRCERFDFRKIPANLIIERLKKIAVKEKRSIDIEVLEEVARSADGALRDAESLLGKLLSLSGKRITLKDASCALPIVQIERVHSFAAALVRKDTEKALTLIEQIADDGEDVKRLLDAFLEFMREVLIAKATNQKPDDESLRGWLKEYEGLLTLELLKSYIDRAFVAKEQTRYETIPTFPLELMVIELTQLDGSSNTAVHVPSESTASSERKKARIQRSVNRPVRPHKNTALPSTKPSKSLSEVLDKWQEVVTYASKENASLGVILRLTNPVEYTKNILKLGLTYKLHFEKMQNGNVRNDLESVLKKVFKRAITIEPVLQSPNKIEKKDLNSLAEAFGGKVV